jgi:large subunit ribosomal protein L3
VTVIECPPLKIVGVRLYRQAYEGKRASNDILFKTDRDILRKIVHQKVHKGQQELDKLNMNDCTDVRALVYTQPRLAGIGKKRPEIFEAVLGGSIAEKIKFIKDNHDKELPVNTFFKDGEFIDVHSVTKGKGLQGPVKRFGVTFKNHKTEKGVRRVGTLGGWSAQGHVLYRTAHPGQMGYHLRTEFNKKIIKIGIKPEDVNPKGGWPHYGMVKSSYVLIRGSVAGPQKRAILLTKPMRDRPPEPAPTIVEINREAK